MKHSQLKKYYNLERTIGTGGFAKVKLATHLTTGEKVAVKIINKESSKTDTNRVSLEISAMKTLSHKNICQLYQVLETETHYYLVTEYCAGGELFDHIVEREHLDEESAREFFKQIVSAVAYLHSQGYAHRDIKPENILLDKNGVIKLIDFGLCAQPGNNMLLTSCGSPTYAAPELIRGTQYLGSSADIWSLGVVLYAIVVGKLPFDDETFEKLYMKIQNGSYGDPAWLSSECRELIRGLLQVDPEKRFSIPDICNSKWMTKGEKPAVLQLSEHNNITHHMECIELMAQYKGLTQQALWDTLLKQIYDHDTATYLILCKMYENKQPLRINVFERRNRLEEMFCPTKKTSPGNVPSVICNLQDMDDGRIEDIQLHDICYSPLILRNSPVNNLSPLSSALENNEQMLKANLFRKHTRINDVATAQRRNATVAVRHIRRKSASGMPQENRRPSIAATYSPDPNNCGLTPVIAMQLNKTPRRSSARRVLGSIERSMHRVRRALTPRRGRIGTPTSAAGGNPGTPNSNVIPDQCKVMPQVLNAKSLSNVSTTTAVDPELVLLKLRTALYEKGIFCKQKGYTLRGRMEISKKRDTSAQNVLRTLLSESMKPNTHAGSSSSSDSSKNDNSYCSFELEVCLLDTAVLGGGESRVLVRRKRLKGDAWCYKKVCEEVLRITSTEFLEEENFLGVTRFVEADSTS